jgi:hypothetical protein
VRPPPRPQFVLAALDDQLSADTAWPPAPPRREPCLQRRCTDLGQEAGLCHQGVNWRRWPVARPKRVKCRAVTGMLRVRSAGAGDYVRAAIRRLGTSAPTCSAPASQMILIAHFVTIESCLRNSSHPWSGSRGALLRPRPPQNRTCQFPGIRLKQAARAARAAVQGSCAAGRSAPGDRRRVSGMWWSR